MLRHAILRTRYAIEHDVSHAGQIHQIDQIDRPDPNLLLRYLVQDPYSIDPTPETCARPCRMCGSHPVNIKSWIIPIGSASALKRSTPQRSVIYPKRTVFRGRPSQAPDKKLAGSAPDNNCLALPSRAACRPNCCGTHSWARLRQTV